MKRQTFFSLFLVALMLCSAIIVIAPPASAATLTNSALSDVATDGTYLYSYDLTAKRVEKWNINGNLIMAYYGSSGTGQDQLGSGNGHLCTDGTYVYIADPGNGRIQQRYASDFSFIREFKNVGTTAGTITRPYAICCDSNNVYVTDTDVSSFRVVKFDKSLNYVSQLTTNSPKGFSITQYGTSLYLYDAAAINIWEIDKSTMTRLGTHTISGADMTGCYFLATDGTYLYQYVAPGSYYRLYKIAISDWTATYGTLSSTLGLYDGCYLDGKCYVGSGSTNGPIRIFSTTTLANIGNITTGTIFVPWAATFTSAPPTNGQAGTAYTYTPTTNESASITAPTLPAWATYSGGTISGTPSAAGTYAFQIHAVSTAGTLASNQWWNMTVSESPVPSAWSPTFTSMASETGTVGEEYSYAPVCNETATFELETFPAWAGWVDGVVIGLPNAAGSYSFSLKATSSAGTLSSWQNWTVAVSEATPTPAFTNSPDLNGTRRVWYSWTPTVTLSPCYYTLNGTASFLTINSYTGKVSGLPTSAGTFNVTITALSIDYGTSASISYVLTVADALDPPQDTGDDSGGTDNGGSDNGGTIIAAIPDYYIVTGLVILAILAIAIIGASRRR